MRVLLTGLTARAIAESAVRADCDVVTVDYFGDLDTKRLCPNVSLRERGCGYSAAALARVARELPYDAVAYGGGLENHPEAVEALAEGKVLLGNAPETLRRVRDPALLFPFLAARQRAWRGLTGGDRLRRREASSASLDILVSFAIVFHRPFCGGLLLPPDQGFVSDSRTEHRDSPPLR